MHQSEWQSIYQLVDNLPASCEKLEQFVAAVIEIGSFPKYSISVINYGNKTIMFLKFELKSQKIIAHKDNICHKKLHLTEK